MSQLELDGQPGVEKVVPILKPYKLASRAQHREASIFDIDGAKIGGGHFSLIAGPCTVESREQLLTTAEIVRDAGANMLRGGAYKPRTSPYAFQGLGVGGAAPAGRGQGRDGPADRHRADGRPRRRARRSRSPT